MTMKKATMILLLACLLLTGCQGGQTQTTGEESLPPETTAPGETVQVPLDPESLFSDRDHRTDYTGQSLESVVFSDGGATVSGSATVDGSTVTVTGEGTYVLSGACEDGTLIVDADKKEKIWLVLDGLTLNSASGAAIYIRQADKVFITLAPGSVNLLSNGGSFVQTDDNTVDAVIFSKDDLTLNGTGSLELRSPGGHGIVSKDDLRITGGTYQITASGHGLCGKDALSVADGSFTVYAGKDGFHGENKEDASLGSVYLGGGTYSIISDGDGISAGNVLQVDGGSFTVTSGGGSENGKDHQEDWPGGYGIRGELPSETEEQTASAKGLKASGALYLRGGIFQMDCADDAFHTNGSLTVSAGDYTVATGDDGFHADEALTVDGGTVNVTASYEGLEGLTVTINGGELTIHSEDDGLNAAGGNDGSGFGGFGNMGGWESMEDETGRPGAAPEKPEGSGQEQPVPDEKMPQMPDNGQPPDMPDGESPAGPDGEMPQMPDNGQGGGRKEPPGNMGGFGSFGGDRFGSSSDCLIRITGGSIRIYADGDGIDSNGDLEITGGYVLVEGPTDNGNGALDYNGTGTITGGTVIASGASGMAQSLTSAGTQGVLSVNTGTCPGGTEIKVTDSAGNILLTVTPGKSFSSIVISTPELQKGESYLFQTDSKTKTVTAQ